MVKKKEDRPKQNGTAIIKFQARMEKNFPWLKHKSHLVHGKSSSSEILKKKKMKENQDGTTHFK